MPASTCIRLGAVLAGFAVALGAFAAHGMKAHYSAEMLQTFDTGVRYQMFHALALLLCGALGGRGRCITIAAWSFAIGTLFFSGSLYALVWLDVRWLGAITPIGGVAFLVGWATLAIGARATSPATEP